MVRLGWARQVMAGGARHGPFRHGWARHGAVRLAFYISFHKEIDCGKEAKTRSE